ncbi:MAG: hypothetical protein AB1918_01450 [Pseudomonadota bacterium]
MWFGDRYPVFLELSAADRDRALVWLLKNHSRLDCKVDDADGGGAVVRVGTEDAKVLEDLAALLG